MEIEQSVPLSITRAEPSRDEDAQWIAICREGDLGAFERLVRKYRGLA